MPRKMVIGMTRGRLKNMCDDGARPVLGFVAGVAALSVVVVWRGAVTRGGPLSRSIGEIRGGSDTGGGAWTGGRVGGGVSGRGGEWAGGGGRLGWGASGRVGGAGRRFQTREAGRGHVRTAESERCCGGEEPVKSRTRGRRRRARCDGAAGRGGVVDAGEVVEDVAEGAANGCRGGARVETRGTEERGY